MDRSEIGQLEHKIREEISALLAEVDVNEDALIEPIQADIAALEAELAFVRTQRAPACSERRSLTLEEELASLRIENQLLKELRRLDGEIAAVRKQTKRLGCKLKLLRIKKRFLGLTLKERRSAVSVGTAENPKMVPYVLVSLDDKSEYGGRWANVIEDPAALEGLENVGRSADSEADDDAPGILSSLSPQEANVLRMRFGIGDSWEHTHEEIARDLGLTLAEVQEIEARALRLLRSRGASRLWGLLGSVAKGT
jgi:hypothetical protein